MSCANKEFDHVARWYDRQTKSWVVQRKDAEGNQVGEADYVYSREEAIRLADQYLRAQRA